MTAAVIPFSILPPQLVIKFSKNVVGLGHFISNLFPSLDGDLKQAQYPYNAREYSSITAVVSISNAVIFFLILALVSVLTNANLWIPAVLFALLVGVASFLTVVYYPQLMAGQKVKVLENQLLPATRQLVIELKSGVTLFNAMTSVSTGYGEVSLEFKKIVHKVTSGTPEIDALEEASSNTPSHQFRKVLWQIANSLKVGSDVGVTLEGIIEDLTVEELNSIKNYAQELGPWTMIYMMASSIVPSLGVTILIVIVSLLNVVIPPVFLMIILLLLLMFQLFFMNFIKSRRPLV